ncbi:30S ribosomal protein S8 [Methylomonas sp. MED-D]|uniref:Small ribosomal subunit protein uS8 n=1 Tax=Methylomonas koyamae TaxID=702114 RepID=A0A177NK03_9GAMM|nr:MULTISPECIES: 30S ribosomal protein S8 [Methylomonas]NJA06593.1 30S ribosomal protein S8 [Methylococcaceae bacterium WWC4]MDT4330010.1 30S ribosomal protein S8 [Methylomonas sp. MV1]OAI18192.1 30S ribosomal protein S8 [Methylomonas koyamae]OHX35918.1 30S ribosomal protein S8 [Methylomonas sp. LWB]WGS86861.1 30S ribosomal protein S8 [Methylomonas sp. UP202]
MSMTDPIADMLTRIRNGQAAGKKSVKVPSSKLKLAIAKVLKEEGYISDYKTEVNGTHTEMTVDLKYHNGVPVIENVKRISRPGLRIYRSKDQLPKVLGGLGIAIVSTSSGVMTDRAARAIGHGGEIICTVC